LKDFKVFYECHACKALHKSEDERTPPTIEMVLEKKNNWLFKCHKCQEKK